MNSHYETFFKKNDIENKRLSNIMNELDRLFLIYKSEYNQLPDCIKFSGNNGKLIYDIIKNVMNGAFDVVYNDTTPCEVIEFSSKSTPVKNITDEIGSPKNEPDLFLSERSDGLIPYSNMESVQSKISAYTSNFSAKINKNVQTVCEFYINVSNF